MRVAIIESDAGFINELENKISNQGWDVAFYTDTLSFSHATLHALNVVFANKQVNGMTGYDLFKSIHNKTNADLYLMSESLESFCEQGAQHDYIKGFVKRSADSLLTKLQYIESKLRIVSLATTGEHSLNQLMIKANGYSFNVYNGVAYIGLRTFLSCESKRHLFEKVEELGLDKAIISYPGQDNLTPTHYKQLLDICGFFQNNGKKLVFWNIENNACIDEIIRGCKLNRIMPIFNNTGEAISYLNDT